MNTVFIYALNCPITGRTRYVGKSKTPDTRFYFHLRSAEDNHKARWISKLKSRGLQPVLEILDEVLEADWRSWEAAYIEFFIEAGFDLVNSNPGGAGVSRHTHEARAKQRAARLGKISGPHSVETREKMRIAKVGKSNHCEGRVASDGTRNKLADAARKRIWSAESRARMRASQKLRQIREHKTI